MERKALVEELGLGWVVFLKEERRRSRFLLYFQSLADVVRALVLGNGAELLIAALERKVVVAPLLALLLLHTNKIIGSS